MRKIDLTGKRFGKLVVIKEVTKSNTTRRHWLVLCDCGKEKVIRGSHLTTKK